MIDWFQRYMWAASLPVKLTRRTRTYTFLPVDLTATILAIRVSPRLACSLRSMPSFWLRTQRPGGNSLIASTLGGK